MNFLDLINEGKSFSYYSDDTEELAKIDIFKDPVKYIEKYFKYGCKDFSLFLNDSTLLTDYDRCRHMCSLYSFGTIIAIKSNLFNLIESKYNPYIPKSLVNHNKSFLYYWFLVSLYHDVAYGIKSPPNIEYDLFKYRHSKKKFINDILESKVYNKKIKEIFENYSRIQFSHLSGNKKLYHTINNYYRPKTYKIYFSYRNNEISDPSSNKSKYEYIEHGIAGGLLFYNNMLMAYKKALQQNYTINDEFVIDYNNIVWFPEQIDIFKDLGFIIATHNLWKENFNKYGINESFKNVNSKNPLLFLLCLCDTIDPYKYLMKNEVDISIIMNILKAIDIDINKNEIIVYKPKTNEYNIVGNWYSDLKKELEHFIKIKVNVCNERTVITW